MKRIVVLVSGGGTNLQALLDAQDRGEIPGGQITCVIASKPGVYALERAAAHGIPGKVLERKAYPDVHAYSAAMRDLLLAEQADLVVYAGFLTILDEQVVDAFPGLAVARNISGAARFNPSGPAGPPPLLGEARGNRSFHHEHAGFLYRARF